MSSYKTIERMEKRVAQLSDHFAKYLEAFEKRQIFAGPSFYFHHKTLAVRRKYATVDQVLQADEIFDWMYATLTAWGLHRMGPGNAKLGDIEELKSSFRLQAKAIQQVESLCITDIHKEDISQVAQKLWSIISQLKVSIAESQIVANSKALHHLLPSLVPPIDRTYTYNFFYNRNTLSISEKDAFQEMYLQFHKIAVANTEQIQTRLGEGWNTSETKVIDNALVGYVLKELRQVVE